MIKLLYHHERFVDEARFLSLNFTAELINALKAKTALKKIHLSKKISLPNQLFDR